MTPFDARLKHVPGLLAVLWQHRTGHWWDDVKIMVRMTRRGCVRAVRDDTRLAGFILCTGPELHALYVHPKAQGKGVGRLLLLDAKRERDRLNLWVAQKTLEGGGSIAGMALPRRHVLTVREMTRGGPRS